MRRPLTFTPPLALLLALLPACTPATAPADGDAPAARRAPTWAGPGIVRAAPAEAPAYDPDAPTASPSTPPATTTAGSVAASGAPSPPQRAPEAADPPVLPPPRPPHSDPMPGAGLAARVTTGADALVASGFERLRGQRVGLIANHTTTSGGRHLADWMAAPASGVRLTALFGPEHGVRGDADAGALIADGRDAATGVPVYSLYGRNRRPTADQMANLDVLVYDVQDVGARFYTFISTMGLSMQSAAERGIPFVVLDRPNPLGGRYLGGFTLAGVPTSFIGQFPIPTAYGLTAGELARMIVGEKMLPGLDGLQLEVVSAAGWGRDQIWTATGLPWVAPSPNIPTFESALLYAGTCLFEGVAASEGRGTRQPFSRLGAPGMDADALAADLNRRGLAGVRFRPVRFTPVSIAGMSAEPKFKNTPVAGIDIEVTDASAVDPTAVAVHALDAFLDRVPGGDRAAFFNRADFFDRLAGSSRLRSLLTYDTDPAAILTAIREDNARFDRQREPYLLYR